MHLSSSVFSYFIRSGFIIFLLCLARTFIMFWARGRGHFSITCREITCREMSRDRSRVFVLEWAEVELLLVGGLISPGTAVVAAAVWIGGSELNPCSPPAELRAGVLGPEPPGLVVVGLCVVVVGSAEVTLPAVVLVLPGSSGCLVVVRLWSPLEGELVKVVLALSLSSCSVKFAGGGGVVVFSFPFWV